MEASSNVVGMSPSGWDRVNWSARIWGCSRTPGFTYCFSNHILWKIRCLSALLWPETAHTLQIFYQNYLPNSSRIQAEIWPEKQVTKTGKNNRLATQIFWLDYFIPHMAWYLWVHEKYPREQKMLTCTLTSDNPVNHRFLQKERKIMYNCVFMLMENVS